MKKCGFLDIYNFFSKLTSLVALEIQKRAGRYVLRTFRNGAVSVVIEVNEAMDHITST